MSRDWPLFRLTGERSDIGRWEGSLRPLCKSYPVEIVLVLPGRRRAERQPNPRVTVLSDLRQCPIRPNAPIPHIYPNLTVPQRPHLCLFHPPRREWHLGLAIAETIVPWAAEWLFFYEVWLATGEWTGGGIEH